MRILCLPLVLVVCACGDNRNQLAFPNCVGVAGTSSEVHFIPSEAVSPLTVCQGGGEGFVVLNVGGKHSAYGDPQDPNFANVIGEFAFGCPTEAGDFTASRTFWAQIKSSLSADSIVHHGTLHHDCGTSPVRPMLGAIEITDWANLDATIVTVEKALRERDICSSIAVEVRGPGCVRPAGADQ